MERREIIEYIVYYNNDRLKLNLKGMSPIQYRAHYHKN
ncbi:IS3 family transposase [Flavobacterium sharifuzzamanii]